MVHQSLPQAQSLFPGPPGGTARPRPGPGSACTRRRARLRPYRAAARLAGPGPRVLSLAGYWSGGREQVPAGDHLSGQLAVPVVVEQDGQPVGFGLEHQPGTPLMVRDPLAG